MSQKEKNIAFICPYPYDSVGGQRFRYEQYLALLNKHGFEYSIFPFLDETTYSVLYKEGHTFKKFLGVIGGFIKRVLLLFKLTSYQFVFIFRETTPVGIPFFEWFIAKVLRKKIIYDFDDAIWIQSTSSENKIISIIKFSNKVGMICKWSYKVSVGNQYLKKFAEKYNSNTIINPTTIDTTNHHNKVKNQESDKIVIGWTGTHSTLKYLDIIYPVLKRLEKKYDFIVEVIADKEIYFDLKNYRYKNWSRESEIQDLMNFNIGVMPLYDDEWSKGKCGFKALQYMSLGIPAVVSPVGVNEEIVTDGVDGFCCLNEEEWYSKISLLIENYDLRKKMGEAAINKVKLNYSLTSNSENFIQLFQ